MNAPPDSLVELAVVDVGNFSSLGFRAFGRRTLPGAYEPCPARSSFKPVADLGAGLGGVCALLGFSGEVLVDDSAEANSC